MKKYIVATLLLTVAVVAWKHANCHLVTLSSEEMEGIVGMEWSGWACIQCIDGCASVGQEADCTGNCEYTDPYSGDRDGDYYSCNSLYSQANNPSETIWTCSFDNKNGYLYYCEEFGDTIYCGQTDQCWCMEGPGVSDFCNTKDLGNYSDMQNCYPQIAG